MNNEYREIAENKFGYFWDYNEFFKKNKSIDEYRKNIIDLEELEYFMKFENSMIGKFLSKLTEEEKSAIVEYTSKVGSTFKEINTGLRNNYFTNSYYKNQSYILENAINKFYLEEDSILYRAVDINAFLSLGINSIEELYNLTEYTDDSFMCCSLFPDASYGYFENYPIVFEIYAPAGTSGMYAEFTKAIQNEDFEFILNKGTTLEINGFREETINGFPKIIISSNVKERTNFKQI